MKVCNGRWLLCVTRIMCVQGRQWEPHMWPMVGTSSLLSAGNWYCGGTCWELTEWVCAWEWVWGWLVGKTTVTGEGDVCRAHCQQSNSNWRCFNSRCSSSRKAKYSQQLVLKMRCCEPHNNSHSSGVFPESVLLMVMVMGFSLRRRFLRSCANTRVEYTGENTVNTQTRLKLLRFGCDSCCATA